MSVPRPNCRWLKVHLSTAVLLMLAAGILLSKNLISREVQRSENYFAQARGWPLTAYLSTNMQVCCFQRTWISIPNIFFENVEPVGPHGITRVIDYFGAAIDGLAALGILIAVIWVAERLGRAKLFVRPNVHA